MGKGKVAGRGGREERKMAEGCKERITELQRKSLIQKDERISDSGVKWKINTHNQ